MTPQAPLSFTPYHRYGLLAGLLSLLAGSSCEVPCIGDPAATTVRWTDDIWNTGSYPDDRSGTAGVAVDLSGLFCVENLVLDVAVEIPSLTVGNGITLLLAERGVGDLFVGSGGLRVTGTILVAGDRQIDVAGGDVVIADGGRYQADPAATGPVRATLTTGDLTIEEGPRGGALQLDDSMTLVVLGNLVLNGAGYDDQGDCTPPDFLTDGNAWVTVQGDVQIIEAADVQVHSENPLTLEGNFENSSHSKDRFAWPGGLRFASGTAATKAHTCEVAGTDQGPSETGLVSNFAMGRVIIQSGNVVTFVDVVDNDGADPPACEALYVDTLELEADAGVVLDHCRVYYRTLIDRRSEDNTTLIGECSALQPIVGG